MSAPLDIAVAVFSQATGGGIERDFIRLARILAGRGHAVTLYTTAMGPIAEDYPVHLLKRRGLSNHARMAAFGSDVAAATRGRHDLVVGFQKLPGLDVLYCGDWCVADRAIPAWKRLLPRHRALMRLERACCGADAKTLLMMLAEPQADAYRRAWSVAPDRMVVLPPTLDRRRILAPAPDARRQEIRTSLGIAPDRVAWFWLGLQPRIKGLDRVIEALALSPRAQLLAAGLDLTKSSVRQALRQAERLGCADRVTLMGRMDDVALDRLFTACDLMVHPARLDVTGTVIVEALGVGMPVIVTANCGYSVHVAASGAGVVVPADATPAIMAEAASASADLRRVWSAAARAYVQHADLTTGLDVAADRIEEAGAR
ncbi:MAG: glycosyltransferase family 4 protein [Rhizobiaceae bacterium]